MNRDRIIHIILAISIMMIFIGVSLFIAAHVTKNIDDVMEKMQLEKIRYNRTNTTIELEPTNESYKNLDKHWYYYEIPTHSTPTPAHTG